MFGCFGVVCFVFLDSFLMFFLDWLVFGWIGLVWGFGWFLVCDLVRCGLKV